MAPTIFMNNKFVSLLVVIFFFAGMQHTHAQIITTIAGGGTSGLGDGGPALSCELNLPNCTATDAIGNLYITDQHNNRVRKVNTAGIVSTVAGTGVEGYSGDGNAATAANLALPWGIAVDVSGNLYISDNANHCIRKVNTAGIITTVAGTGGNGYNGDGIAATAAELYSPHGIALDATGNLYICDVLNNRVRKVNLATGIITTIAGTGLAPGYVAGGDATTTNIGQPFGVATDASGNVFFADLSYNIICKINASGIISTIAGTTGSGYNGDNIPATTAELKQPFSVAIDGSGNIFIADFFNYRVRRVNSSGIITTIAGTGIEGSSGDNGAATDAKIGGVTGLSLDGAGNLYITDNQNSRIRYLKNATYVAPIYSQISNVLICPNPSYSGNIAVDIISIANVEAQIVITDVIGKKIKEVIATTNKTTNINLEVPNGVYFLSAITENERVTEKLVIQR